jgi:3-phosphoshikimate 1-carboxyvinyltransferase
VQTSDDSVLSWDGTRTTPAPHPLIDTYDDHRMAMAFAPAVLRFPDMRIAHPEVVSKSYPNYWEAVRAATTVNNP